MIDLARILFTVLCFSAFIIFVLITYRKGARKGYKDVAQEIIDDNDTPWESTTAEHSSPDATHGNGANK
ncbi:MAG: CcoQ/FixQ family Cbb3-type cytochrome c oxidase assembly chaperone [Neisseria sp.]|nr:CcoQ/FixQ family Cbb3-type cytochrome c oxidase assembly chaperone [Neisseria sp.]